MMQDLIRDNRYLCSHCGQKIEWKPQSRLWWFDYAMVACAFLVIGTFMEKWELDRNAYHFENVKVIKKFDAYRYKMKFASGEYAVWFCHNYRPCIPEGSVLTSLRYEDNGDCWDIKPAGLGYNFLQDERGNDIDETGRIVFDALKDSCE